jgi:hypothetical protein
VSKERSIRPFPCAELAKIISLGNVSEACRLSGVSRDTLYRYRKLMKQGGAEALKTPVNPNLYHGNRTDKDIASTIIDLSLQNPHLGQVQVANHMEEHFQIEISASGVRGVWLHEILQTCALRLHRKESLSIDC